MDDKNFEKLASNTLTYITNVIETKDKECVVEVDYLSDILKIETSKGPFIINKHSAAGQIWLASPISGPYHFSPLGSKWINRDQFDLFDILNTELKQFVDIELKYE
jgi:iron donor protein CyaY